jgi:hypothetical protein
MVMPPHVSRTPPGPGPAPRRRCVPPTFDVPEDRCETFLFRSAGVYYTNGIVDVISYK